MAPPVTSPRRWLISAAVLAAVVAFTGPAGARPPSDRPVRYVSARAPFVGPGRDQAAFAPAHPATPFTSSAVRAGANPWRLAATIPGAVLRDVSFATTKIGYAVAELGKVYKTTDGGRTWTSVLNLGFPFYWYGVDALDANDVVISGFDNAAFTGLVRWTLDGGSTWSDDLVVAPSGWANRVRFADPNDGLAVDLVNLDAANEVQLTTTGGQTLQDWSSVVPDPDGGWFGADFTLLPDLTAYISGITECTSPDGGAAWTCTPPVDPVFDGAVEFVDHRFGWVGGGSISPTVEGWAYRTADGGATWSSRTLHSPWPVRDLEFLGPQVGFAAGGNVFSGVGGIYASSDGGRTWGLDVDTGAEMTSCTTLAKARATQVWCVGTDGSFNGVVYWLRDPTGGWTP
jgi:photosystem II stability/assembly factor-like uncharacterized protein